MDEVIVQSYAKVNLSLDVLGLRDDGYHEISSLMQSVDLHDRIGLKKSRLEDSLEVIHARFPSNEENLVLKALKLIREYTCSKFHAAIRLEKNIPIGAGLAGGSTDAAGTLAGLNILFDLGLGDDELKSLGEMLGSDVPFCIHGGTALAEGRGEKLTPVDHAASSRIILYKPPFSVSTAAVYKDYRPAINKRPMDQEKLIHALQQGRMTDAYPWMVNVLESVTMVQYPQLRDAKQILLEAGAAHVMMSGSGPTLMAFVQNHRLQRKVSEAAASLPGEYHSVTFVHKGQEISAR